MNINFKEFMSLAKTAADEASSTGLSFDQAMSRTLQKADMDKRNAKEAEGRQSALQETMALMERFQQENPQIFRS